MKIYVGNLNFDTTESEIQGLFSEYGEVNSVNIIQDKYSGRSKGFGFVEMGNDDEATQAIENLDGSELRDRQLTVGKAKPPRQRD